MPSIAATPLPALGVMKVVIDWLPTFSSESVRILRQTPDGARTEVIGSPILLSGGQAVVYDTTAPFDVPLIYIAEGVNPIVALDDFNRASSVNGWGSAPIGGAYTVRGSAPVANFSTSATFQEARITNSATNVIYPISLLSNTETDLSGGVTVHSQLGVTTGAPKMDSMFLRYVDPNNYYQFALAWLPTGEAALRVYRRVTVPAVPALLSETIIGPYTFGTSFRIEAEVQGTTLRARAWSTIPPEGWTVELTDPAHSAGSAAWATQLVSGNTNTLPTDAVFSDMVIRRLGTATLTTAGTATLVAGRDGWLRDPQEPGRSVRMDNCDSHTFSCLDADRFVFFQGMDAAQYDSATGVFEVVDAPNPLTVAQTRKGLSTGLRVVSTTLADIPALKALFSPGRDLVVSLPMEYGWGLESYGSEPVTVGSVTEARLNQRDMRKPQRLWTLPIRVTDPDETYRTGEVGTNDIPIPGATYADTTATGLTYAQLTTAGRTYAEWSQGMFT